MNTPVNSRIVGRSAASILAAAIVATPFATGITTTLGASPAYAADCVGKLTKIDLPEKVQSSFANIIRSHWTAPQ